MLRYCKVTLTLTNVKFAKAYPKVTNLKFSENVCKKI